MRANGTAHSHGSILLESPTSPTPSTLTTRKFDKAYFEKTGIVRYIGRANESMPMSETDSIDKMKSEITTLKKFQHVGSYQEVAKKYHIVNVMAVHGWLRQLLKMEREKVKASGKEG